ncbi:MAG: hypothetical protein NW217_08025 [Hyphomicrobiaceae bacterium]|nr:hypothetical protein [Hyphomicrobiaceae bacterium]
MKRLFVAMLLLLVAGLPGHAEQPGRQSRASAGLGLKLGYDSNPLDEIPTTVRSFFGSADGFVSYVNSSQSDALSAKLTAIGVAYDARDITETRVVNAELDYEAKLSDKASTRQTTQYERTRSFSQESDLILLRNRSSYAFAWGRLGLRTDLKDFALNEQNALLGGEFLEEPEVYRSASLLPSAILTLGPGEIGISTEASRVLFANEADLIGFDRAHDLSRLNIFGSVALDRVSVEGSVSPTRIRFHEDDYDDIAATLYSAKAVVTSPQWTGVVRRLALETSITRTVEQTTFPLSVYQIERSRGASLAAGLDGGWSVAVYGRQLRTLYEGIDILVLGKTFGLEVEKQLSSAFALSARADWRQQRIADGGQPVEGFSVQFGVNQKFDLLK